MKNILNGIQNAISVVTEARSKLSEIKSRSEQAFGKRSDNGRIESDRLTRREPGGENPRNHLDNDWAGRTILGNYLAGGGDQVITNDPDWTEYMQNNHILSNELDLRAVADAQQLYNMSDDQVIRIDENFPTQIENGESIIGYQYLHGTNGGLGRTGTISIERNPDGTAVVNLDMQYSWNDVIDPNGKYSTDTVKNRIAEAITLGKADPYDMQINWSENTQIVLDKDGNVSKINRDADPNVQRNYPGNRNDDPTIESIRTESTRDVDAVSSPVTNKTVTTRIEKLDDKTEIVTETTKITVTSPTGGTYSPKAQINHNDGGGGGADEPKPESKPETKSSERTSSNGSSSGGSNGNSYGGTGSSSASGGTDSESSTSGSSNGSSSSGSSYGGTGMIVNQQVQVVMAVFN